MRRDLILIVLIAAAAFGIRTYPAWNSVLSDGGISFLETDAWYHVRLVENQVRNYPWRVTLDPYATAGGQFVPIAPLFDTLTSTIVVLVHGRDATTEQVERIAAFVPPVLGALTVVAAWALGWQLFGRRAGLVAAALLAVLPGHFLDRTMLGFVDHHALEALLAVVTLLAFSVGARNGSMTAGAVAGLGLGLYLLAWGSGAFLIAIIAAWLLLFVLLARTSDDLVRASLTTGVAALVAFTLVVVFQDARMHRYGSQIIGVTGLAGLALAVAVATRGFAARPRKRVIVLAVLIVGGLASLTVTVLARDLVRQVLIDVARLAPDPARMNVLEARPLFLYPGEWNWGQPWLFFRTGFFIGVVALVPFAVRVWRHRQAPDLLILTFTVAVLVATIGQNRFGYYLVTACAVLGGWLASCVLDWGGVPHADDPRPAPNRRIPLAREVAVVLVAGGMFAPNLPRSVLLAERSTGFPSYWRDTMTWLRQHTPPPFRGTAGRGDEFYYARYPEDSVPRPDYSIMNWWDQGYWLAQSARRVAVSNPTQHGAPIAGRFYSETDEAQARELLRAQGSRYVLADWELPFRRLADGAIMGRFQSVVDWAGRAHAPYYEIYYRRDTGRMVPIWIFHEAYYRSMAFRLAVLGAAAGLPANSTSVITYADRVDPTGMRFRELLTDHTYATFEAARQAAGGLSGAIIVGLDPWQPAFPLEPLQSLVPLYAAHSADQATTSPWVRVFEVR